MNGSDIDTSSNRGVAMGGTSGTATSSQRRIRVGATAYPEENLIHSRRTFRQPPNPERPHEHRRPRHHDPPISLRERLLAWKEILETANPPATRPLDTVGKWLVITRPPSSR